MSENRLKITLVRSVIGRPAKVKAWVAGLGLKRPHDTVLLADTPAIRGMLAKVPHMVSVDSGESRKGARAPKAARKTSAPKAPRARKSAASPKASKETGENA